MGRVGVVMEGYGGGLDLGCIKGGVRGGGVGGVCVVWELWVGWWGGGGVWNRGYGGGWGGGFICFVGIELGRVVGRGG